MGVQAWDTRVAAGLLERVMGDLEETLVVLLVAESIGTQLGSASIGVSSDAKYWYFARKLAMAAILQQRTVAAGDVVIDDHCLGATDERPLDGAAVAVRSAATAEVIGAVVLLGTTNARAEETLRRHIAATDGITFGEA